MAYDYDKAKQTYQSMTKEQQQQYVDQNKNSESFKRFMNDYMNDINGNKNTTTNTTQNTGSTVTKNTINNSDYGQPTEYQPGGTTRSNSYVNQGEGTYKYDEGTKYYEKQGGNQNTNSIREKWDSLSYDEQQAKLKENPNLKEGITKVGGTIKQSPYENQGEGNYYYDGEYYRKEGEKPKTGDNWDYQDNSPERMAEIIRNLDDLSKSNPGLFTDYNSFYNAFIAGKGRTQEQIDTLNDYFNRMKQYSKYDNLSSSDLGYGLAHGQPYEDYLAYLKYNDPQRYAEIQEARKAEEDKIKSDASMDTIGTMTGEIDPSKTSTGKVIEWLKAQGLFVDKDGNLIDDRTENYASEEELGYQKQIADLNAANLDIDNTVKHTYDDLVKKYPGATKATLMAMAQDMNSDLLREKENNLVELTRLQGYVSYMQQEREDRTQIGKDSISQLQKEYGMYYDYSPEGMSELAQAQYAATNVTLDQADNGTDTQKQMALDSVLTDYFDKYGSIIQRSKSQVINDVMAYAKKNGVSLSQALEDNFLKFLRQKPGFEQLSSYGGGNPEVFKIGENTYGYWDENGNLIPIGSNIVGTGVGTMRTERNNNPTAMTTDVAKSLGGVEGVDYVQGDSFQTADGRTLYTAKLLGDPIETTIKLLDNAASTGRGAFYTKGGAQRWSHTAMSDAEWMKLTPDQKQSVVLQMLQREGGDINKMAGYNQGLEGTNGGELYNPNLVQIFKQWGDKPDSANAVKDFWNTYGDEVAAAGVSKEDFLKQYDEWYAKESADAYLEVLAHLDQLIELTGGEYDLGERWQSLLGYGDAGRAYDYIKNNLTVNGLRDAKEQGLKLGVLSDSDVKMIGNAATTLSLTQGQESWNRELNDFREKLLSKNKYLRQRYQNTSAYTPNTSISFDNTDRAFTIGTQANNSKTRQAKNIKSLGI